ncbi:TonB-linked SusC/RagA family outer membrane protein [Arcticibacter tournemirensis]|uniref:SusC/RagA family TonB-linked outer membrane protein n=1 Tax=Arcticibacter tournemirensis TaxID=699437 RepID=A0A5M9HFR1_9SPHI|nr:SusC/RagA family TonB-linked outer membrane protein [Arcticibacter tournemirensis]KAA8484371.1 SusC/RagA family TonB-linked outer membrane protein [Arcticibacter tournemirensis]TQM49811.1 TonB-linked SusC/RagA family outer membrane protein [Arcticibacter tournemirensis]
MSQNLHHFKGGGIGIRVLVLSFLLITLVSLSYGQQRKSISGTVKSASDGLPVIGASVKVKGTTRGTSTNVNGQYTISVSNKETLVFTAIGYKAKEVLVGAQTVVNVQLAEDAVQLKEAVVTTALGIKREVKALGYSATSIQGEQLTEALSNNWTDALSGKIAGVNLVRSNAGPTGSNKIILRGENNLTGENDALIVVDGVVINHGSGRTTGTGSGAYLSSNDSPVDYGSGLNDINPEDIESVTVLKGPGASALYGQRGANGAIIITTKSGSKSKSKGLGITFNSNTSIESVSRWPEYQYEYGQGTEGSDYYSFGTTTDGSSTRSTSSAWGPKFNGQSFFQYDPVTHTGATVRTPWVAYPDNRKDYFETGKTFTNSVSLNGGTDKTSVRFSFTNVDNSWIIPNTGYNRNTIALSASTKVTDKFTLSTKINYTRKWSDNLPSTGYNNQSIMYWNIAWVPNGNLDWLTDYWLPGKENVSQSYPYSSYPDNPYLIAYEMLNKSNRNGMTGNVQATYNFTKDLSLMVRTSLDFSYDQRSQQRPFDTENFKRGMYRTQNIYSQEMSSDFLLKYEKKINKDIDFSISAGGSQLKNNYTKDELRADSLLYAGVYNLGNKAGILQPLPYKSEYAINSLYGLATISYKDYLFVDITGRNDWNSVLANKYSTENTSFSYPSLNVSGILSQMFRLPTFISFAKLRGSVASVGSGGQTPYSTSYTYPATSTFPGGQENPTTLPNLNLKPLRTTSYEVGTDLRFLKDRIGFDVTLYKSDTRDQILSAVIDASSGYRNMIVNAGNIQNKGIEIQANSSVLKKKNGLNWNINATFSANKNTVVSLNDTVQSLTLQNGPGSRGAVIAKVGGSISALYGRGYARSTGGQIIYSGGYPVITDSMLYMGDTNPKWKASIGNRITYKQFTFSFLADAQFGAVAYSLTAANLAEQGKTKNTLPGRYNGIIGKGVIQNADGSYSPNNVTATDIWSYYTLHYGKDNVEGTTYSTDFLKLREARLDYRLSPKASKRLGLQNASIGVYGRDLFMITKWPTFDPEFGTLNDGVINKGFELGQFPSTRTFGVNLVIGI